MKKEKIAEPENEIKVLSKEWSEKHLTKVKTEIKKQQSKRTIEQKLQTRMLSVKYQMEDYLNDEKITQRNMVSLDNFISRYLEVLNISFKKFAQSLDSTDANLKKYLSGERKFSTDLAFKFAAFFHTTPRLWMTVYIKNEIIILEKEKKYIHKYKKYDYEKVVERQ